MTGGAPTSTSPRAPAAQPRAARRRRARHTGPELTLRALGALTLLAVGAVHLDQYFAVHYRVVPIIGPLFVLNFAGATIVGALLLTPVERLPTGCWAAAAARSSPCSRSARSRSPPSRSSSCSSARAPSFGFSEHGYRPAILASLAAEAATTVLLLGYLGARLRRQLTHGR